MCCLLKNSTCEMQRAQPLSLLASRLEDQKAKVRNSYLELLCVILSRDQDAAQSVSHIVGPDWTQRIQEKLQYGVLPTLTFDGLVKYSNQLNEKFAASYQQSSEEIDFTQKQAYSRSNEQSRIRSYHQTNRSFAGKESEYSRTIQAHRQTYSPNSQATHVSEYRPEKSSTPSSYLGGRRSDYGNTFNKTSNSITTDQSVHPVSENYARTPSKD